MWVVPSWLVYRRVPCVGSADTSGSPPARLWSTKIGAVKCTGAAEAVAAAREATARLTAAQKTRRALIPRNDALLSREPRCPFAIIRRREAPAHEARPRRDPARRGRPRGRRA